MASGVGGTLRGLVQLLRPVNALAAGGLTFVGAFVATASGLPPAAPTAAAAGATVLATGAGMAINDYFDREVDAINDPHRPIPSGDVAPRTALVYSLALFALAVALSLSLPLVAIAIAAVNLVALVTYTELFKGTPGLGNALVAYLGGSTFLFGAAAVGSITPTVVVLFVLAAVSTVTREIIKDVEDVAGDREEGLNTLPIAIGTTPALAIAVALLVGAVLASPVPFLQNAFGVAYLLVVLPADAVMLLAAAESFRSPGAAQRHIKVGMFLAAAAFVVGRLATV